MSLLLLFRPLVSEPSPPDPAGGAPAARFRPLPFTIQPAADDEIAILLLLTA
jgi:hypothetical protein